MMIPLLPFIQKDIGLTSFQAGMVLAAFPVVALISNIALGPFIDRFGRKRFIVAGSLGCAVILLQTAASKTVISIVLGRAITGLFMPMIGASIFAAIADYVPAENRSRITGYVTTAAPIAFLISMSIGVLLGGLIAWKMPLILLAFTCLGLAISASTLSPVSSEFLASGKVTVRTYRDRILSLSLNTGIRSILISYLLWATAVIVFMGMYPSWIIQNNLLHWSTGTVGILFLLGENGGLFGAFMSGRLARIFPDPMILCAAGMTGMALVVSVVPLGMHSFVFQSVTYAFFAFGRDLLLALMLGEAITYVKGAQRGSLNAILNALYQTGTAVGGITSAWLYALYPDFSSNMFTACGLFIVTAVILFRTARVREYTDYRS